MNASKHTPGSWETTYEIANKTWGVCGPHGGDVIAQLVEQESHANMLAAAPAMYEALQQAQELLRSLVAEAMIHTTELQRVGNCQATMWQALAQAGGK